VQAAGHNAYNPGEGTRSVAKLFVGAEQLLLDSFRLAMNVHASGYRPDIIIGIWRGGTPVGIAVHEYFLSKGEQPYHTAVKSQSYLTIEKRGKIDVSGTEHVMKLLGQQPRMVLLVDDVFDTGRTMEYLSALFRGARPETEVRIAVAYWKPAKNETSLRPDYWLHETSEWIVFPHEIEGLTDEELREKDAGLHRLLTGRP